MGQTIGRKTAVGNYLFLRICCTVGRGYLARWTYPHRLVWAIDGWFGEAALELTYKKADGPRVRFGSCVDGA